MHILCPILSPLNLRSFVSPPPPRVRRRRFPNTVIPLIFLPPPPHPALSHTLSATHRTIDIVLLRCVSQKTSPVDTPITSQNRRSIPTPFLHFLLSSIPPPPPTPLPHGKKGTPQAPPNTVIPLNFLPPPPHLNNQKTTQRKNNEIKENKGNHFATFPLLPPLFLSANVKMRCFLFVCFFLTPRGRPQKGEEKKSTHRTHDDGAAWVRHVAERPACWRRGGRALPGLLPRTLVTRVQNILHQA